MTIVNRHFATVPGLAAAALVALAPPPAVFAQSPTPPAATMPAPAADASSTPTIYFNAHVFTAEPDHPYAEAVAIRGDRILAVGTLAEVGRSAGAAARKIDLHGRFLMPGMIDAHAHPVQGGIVLTLAHFSEPGTVAALAQFVGEEMRKGTSVRGDVLVVYDIDLSFWPHAAEIDAVLSHGEFAARRIVLFGNDGHTAWANATARTRAGITAAYLRGLSPVDRQHFGHDASFNPDGFVVDAGKIKLDQSLPPFAPEVLVRAGEAAIHYLNSLGITGFLDAQASGVIGGAVPLSVDDPGYLAVYRELAHRGELTAHVAAYPVVQPNLGTPQIEVVDALRKRFGDVPDLTIPGFKIYLDGVVEFPSQTAALTRPYRNSGRSAPLLCQPSELNAIVTEASRRNLNVHIHAIGDLAVKASLDAFAAARAAVPRSDLPFSLTHAEFVDAEDIPRFAQLRVIAVLQLLWAAPGTDSVDDVEPYIDPGIYRTIYPARSILDAGGEIAGASDWFVSSPNPLLAMYVAETRSGPEREGVLDAAQRMPREAMLYAYTRHAAHALGRLGEIGSLAPGKRADMVLIDRDLLTVPVKELLEGASVVWTMFGGRIVAGQAP